MELRQTSKSIVAILQILLFIKSQVLVAAGNSLVSADHSPPSKWSADDHSPQVVASKDVGLDPADRVLYPHQQKQALVPHSQQLTSWDTRPGSWSHGALDNSQQPAGNPWGESGSFNKRWREFSSFGKRSMAIDNVGTSPRDDDRWKNIESPEKRWGEMAVWGKRDANPDKKWGEMAVWGKRDTSPDKKWGEMAVWGKRDASPTKKWKEMAVWGKRDEIPDKKWKEVSVWGKRDENPDKKWKEVSVWGKRDETPDKKWKEVSVWGKRDETPDKKWKEVSVWGKRDETPDKKWKEVSVWGKRDETPDKKWKEVSVWGKRGGLTWRDLIVPGQSLSQGDFQPNALHSSPMADKRWKEMSVWGKRGQSALDKKWKEMAVWGKRSLEPELFKKWKEMAVWGKRSAAAQPDDAMVLGKRSSRRSASAIANFRPFQDLRHLASMSGKRPSWRRTGFNSWGKRSSALGQGEITMKQKNFQNRLHELRKFLLSSAPQATQEYTREEISADKTAPASV